MKNVTMALTIAAALATLGKAGIAQSASDLDNLGYDPGCVSWALTDTSATDEQGLLAAVNAARQAKGMAPLALDPTLTAAARYQIMDQIAARFSGLYAEKADQATQVDPAQLATDFGASPAGVQDSVFSDYSYIYHSPQATGDWNTLVKDWTKHNYEMGQIMADPGLTRAGIGLVATSLTIPTYLGPIPVMRWAILTGY